MGEKEGWEKREVGVGMGEKGSGDRGGRERGGGGREVGVGNQGRENERGEAWADQGGGRGRGNQGDGAEADPGGGVLRVRTSTPPPPLLVDPTFHKWEKTFCECTRMHENVWKCDVF